MTSIEVIQRQHLYEDLISWRKLAHAKKKDLDLKKQKKAASGVTEKATGWLTSLFSPKETVFLNHLPFFFSSGLRHIQDSSALLLNSSF